MHKEGIVAIIKSNGKVLRESNDGNIFIPFGSEYSIHLKNLTHRRAAVSVHVDGSDILDGSKLILEANEEKSIERSIVDGDLNSGRKLKFIEKTQDISDYRGDRIEDGFIRIGVQFEKQDLNISWTNNTSPWGPNLGGVYYGAAGNIVDNYEHIKAAAHDVSTRRVNLDSNNTENSIPQASYSTTKGITVEGSESTQQFSSGYIGPLEKEVNLIVFQLNGVTETEESIQKPVYVDTKKTCSSCGRTYKSSYEYCPKDGTYLRVK